MSEIYRDENQAYQFDFSAALWASDALHDTYSKTGLGILSDVDFIVETEDCVILIEYKNANISNATHPEKFNPLDQKRENKIAFKFYDSWIYLSAIGNEKPVKYVYVLEFPHADIVMRKRIRNHIADLLPFKLQKLPEIQVELIHDFEVLSIAEWNTNEQFKAFPITPVLAK